MARGLRESHLPETITAAYETKAPLLPLREKRLSWRSSDLFAPWHFLPQDGVEDCEQLSGDGDERNELGFACGDEPVSERLEERVVTGRDHCAEKKGAAHALAPAADEALAAPLARLPRPGSKPGQGGDLP